MCDVGDNVLDDFVQHFSVELEALRAGATRYDKQLPIVRQQN